MNLIVEWIWFLVFIDIIIILILTLEQMREDKVSGKHLQTIRKEDFNK